MISRSFGKQLRKYRERLHLPQAELARRAHVSRSVISRLENERDSPVQSNVIDQLAAALGTNVQLFLGDQYSPRREERLRQQLLQQQLKERHFRIALDLMANPAAAKRKIQRALKQVQLWEAQKVCSQQYIDRWRGILELKPRELAVAMTSLGDWENAMFQNSPWSFAWT
jgi:transcriptional regulator with XRE-family HTH domain